MAGLKKPRQGGKGSQRIKLLVTLLSTLLYFALFLIRFPIVPTVLISLILIPMVMIGGWFGVIPAVFAAVIGTFSNLVILAVLYPETFVPMMSSIPFWVGHIIFLAIAVTAGTIHDRRKPKTAHQPVPKKAREGGLQEAFYRHITENTTDLTVVINDQLHTTYVSPSIKNITGYEPSEVIGNFRNKLLAKEEVPYIEEQIRKLIKESGAGTKISPIRLRHKDGHWVYFEGLMTNLMHEPSVQGIAVVGHDITQHILAERELQQSESFYNRLIRLSPTAITIHREGRIIFANKTALDLLQAEDESQVVGKSVHDFVDPADHPLVDKRIQLSVADNTGVDLVEEKWLRVSGEPFRAEIFSVPISFEGKFSFLVMVRDVTEQLTAQDALQESENRYRALFDQNKDGVILVDLNGLIVDVNPTIIRWTGFSKKELCGQNFRTFISPPRETDENSAFQSLMETGTAPIFEFAFPTASEGLFPVEITLSMARDRDNKPFLIQCFARDIKKRKLSEELLKERDKLLKEFEFRYEALFQQTSDAIILYHLNGRVVEGNAQAAALFGYETKEDMVGENFLRHVHPEEKDEEIEKLSQLVGGLIQPYYERTIIRNDGNTRIGEVNLSLVRDTHNRPKYIQSIIRDITKRKNLEKKLRDKASFDSLTNLLNRETFKEQISYKLLQASQRGERGALLFIDLDDFKPVNDTFGHKAGDFTLRTIANRLIYIARDSSLIARHGGDEFVIWLEDIRSKKAALEMAVQIKEAIKEPLLYQAREFKVSCSIGVHLFPRPGTSPDDLIKDADKAMYEAKQQGKNKIFVFGDYV